MYGRPNASETKPKLIDLFENRNEGWIMKCYLIADLEELGIETIGVWDDMLTVYLGRNDADDGNEFANVIIDVDELEDYVITGLTYNSMANSLVEIDDEDLIYV